MSFIAMAWAARQQLPTREKMVLMMLADRANDEGVCWPSTTTLAKASGMSRSTAELALRKLESMGAITTRHRTDGGVNLSNLYTVNMGWGAQARVVGVVRQPDDLPRETDEGCPPVGPEPVIEPPKEPDNNNNDVQRARERIVFDGETGAFTGISDEMRTRWTRAFAPLDVDAEVERAACWMAADHARHGDDLTSFLTNWMCRALDRRPQGTGLQLVTHRGAGRRHQSASDRRAEWAARLTGRTDEDRTIEMPA